MLINFYHDPASVIRQFLIFLQVEEKSSLTAEELAQHIGLSVILAKER